MPMGRLPRPIHTAIQPAQSLPPTHGVNAPFYMHTMQSLVFTAP
ncbi:hypothetical protein CcCBS67573_g09446 [Chytriomyces confervae]|uniref:Uncharacterized protein n=1 Tax=Chytriomyces confervae TaxID=246404 RepID=A0A507DVL1_9FUNG|nr:hypothetical protein CcCBS67573_g09446 [Chytriomyces confervae]